MTRVFMESSRPSTLAPGASSEAVSSSRRQSRITLDDGLVVIEVAVVVRATAWGSASTVDSRGKAIAVQGSVWVQLAPNSC